VPERETITELTTVKYTGPFHVGDLYKFLNEWLGDRRYDMRDKDQSEAVRPDGKYIEVAMRPDISISPSAKYRIWIDLTLSHVKDVTLNLDGHKRKMQEGEVWIGIRSFLETDTEGQWQSNPIYMVIRSAFNRYFHSGTQNQLVGELSKDVKSLIDELKAFFNLYKRRHA